LKGNNDLCFLKKLIESTCQDSLAIELYGEKFEFLAKPEGVVIVHVASGEAVDTYSQHRMADFIHNNSLPEYQQHVDADIYTMVIIEAMKAGMAEGIGMSKASVEVLIGSMAEYEPENIERYLRVLNGIC
jgi:hypothetical protein